MSRPRQDAVILSAKAATGAGTAVNIEDYRHLILSFATDGGGTAALTVKFQGSIQNDVPDFDAAQSLTNHWDYIDVIDMEDGAEYDGDTGISVATADDYRLFKVNSDGLKWLNAVVTARSAGNITIRCKSFNDNK